eukprot:Awhi_evm1s14198
MFEMDPEPVIDEENTQSTSSPPIVTKPIFSNKICNVALAKGTPFISLSCYTILLTMPITSSTATFPTIAVSVCVTHMRYLRERQ